MQSITIETLYPWLEGRGISEEQLDALESAINSLNIETQFRSAPYLDPSRYSRGVDDCH